MARGREALQAANRRLEAAQSHIDRLTDELVDAKMRARTAESEMARLQGIEKLLPQASQRNDAMLEQMVQANARWERVAKADQRRRMEGFKQLVFKVIDDIGIPGLPSESIADRLDLLQTRYPKVLSALLAEDIKSKKSNWRPASPTRPAELKRDGEDLRRFQRALGLRAHSDNLTGEDRDIADVFCAVLDARQIGFTLDEALGTLPDLDKDTAKAS